MGYPIGKFSKMVSLSIDTLRYYEKEHLIVPDRDQNNRRTYTDADQRWIAFIKRLKATGMPIKEIKTYARLRYQGNSTIDERLELLFTQKARLTAQRQEIDAHIAFLENKIATYHQLKAKLLEKNLKK
ncbi:MULTISPECIES: MerR family transcriptional regulator [Lacticaseibacillus]|uniref:Transcriptional regulator n=1 Tax=Lacticaseibacillus casei DSM 20011 = JCM 1134 = ATCC 393 TaxID=1423732 RepID=A0AAD1AP74_LACCA|nr:MerR family transcriptional regulator [Lacticaseibacillus casei]MBI6597499.1 MerR family transcriptional regulator [Lacticaseibacillus casei]MBO1481259.1 MerR family transcriptional regulator [Lacticaseibacillus casei]MBO2416539.1 MerR family transcriptional regulator [Lacticaseibacillus casei]MCK2080900.1 MerR family transcriptional regulator [Lacticaseibacillus casei]MDZ5495465.1 MerR family transcriptional regulator [Lacticaseibacillus casei]